MGLDQTVDSLKGRPTSPLVEAGRQAGLDDPIPLAEVARRIRKRYGRGVHIATLTRWLVDGIKRRDGSRLKAKGDRLPGGWITTERNVIEFIVALTADARRESVPAPSTGTPSVVTSRSAERADRELQRLGI